MKLSELDPKLVGTLDDGALWFDCPFPACQANPAGVHRVRVAISSAPYHERDPRPGEPNHDNRGMPAPDYAGPPLPPLRKVKVWQALGNFSDSLTIQPSIDIIEADAQGNKIRTLCWHGFITNGEIR